VFDGFALADFRPSRLMVATAVYDAEEAHQAGCDQLSGEPAESVFLLTGTLIPQLGL